MKLDSKGQALVELALSLPIFILILFGITEFGRVMYMKNTLTNAAREGARQAVVMPKPITAATIHSSLTTKGFIPFSSEDLDSLSTTINDVASISPGHGAPVKVKLTMPFSPVVSLFPALTLTGEATMAYELL